MIRPGSLFLAACGFFLIAVGVSRPWQAAAQQKFEVGSPNSPMPVLSDTPEYCGVLEQRILQWPEQPPEVKRLLLQGRLLCDHGQVRQGLASLRHALLILKHKDSLIVQP
jgi:hypothetical protein